MRTDIATSVKVRALTEQEEDSLRRYEEAIGRGLRSFVEVGRALQAIRDGRLYRATHRSFGEYCRDRWQMGRAHANRYIDGSTVVGLLSPIGDIPANESQARPLTRIRNAKGDLDREMIRKVWARIVASAPTYPGGRRQITARIIEAEVLPLVLRRQRRARRLRAVADGYPDGVRAARGANRPVRGHSNPPPMVPLSLPLNNPKAAVATLADLFDRAYIEAVVSGLQRFLENGYLESLLEPPALESTTDDPGMASDTAVETGEHE